MMERLSFTKVIFIHHNSRLRIILKLRVKSNIWRSFLRFVSNNYKTKIKTNLKTRHLLSTFEANLSGVILPSIWVGTIGEWTGANLSGVILVSV